MPGRKCIPCSHASRLDIDSKMVAGVSDRAIAGQYQISKSSVSRHRGHIRQAIEQAETDVSSRLVARLQKLEETAGELLQEARDDADKRTAIAALLAGVKCLEALSRILETKQIEERVRTLEEALAHEQVTIQ